MTSGPSSDGPSEDTGASPVDGPPEPDDWSWRNAGARDTRRRRDREAAWRERQDSMRRRQQGWAANRAEWMGRRGRHGHAGRPGWWGDGPPPRFSVGRFAGIVVFLLIVVALTTAVAAWVIGSIFGLIGPDPASGGPLLFLARIGGVALVVLGLWSIARRVRRLTGPIYELVLATRRIEEGDYTIRVSEPVRAPRELRELSDGFNTMAARLEADERQRRSFMADVSHELRTPLTVVQGNIEALVDGVHPPDAEHLGAILDETRVLGRLVDDLRTLAQSEAGTLQLHPEPTDPSLLIADVARSFATVAGAAGSRIVIESGDGAGPEGAADDLPLIEVDPIRIREVLTNLVANALRYTPHDGTVTIAGRTEPDERWLRIEVHDTGPGLAPEVADHVFDRFAKSSDSDGSGLGLAIARYLVEAHGGEIGLLCPPGGGTTAWFRLPLPAA
jgi:signal transduction histidine kinase